MDIAKGPQSEQRTSDNVHVHNNLDPDRIHRSDTVSLHSIKSAVPDRSLATMEVEEHSPKGAWSTALVMVALMLCLFVSALDGTIVATAVPVISHELNSASGYIWIGGAYLLANCAVSLIWAKLSDIWGRKPILLSTMVIFMLGSVICATARTMQTLIAGRAVQGTAGGAVMVLVQICVSDIFSVRRRTLIMGITECIWACAAGIGPTLGGVFASLASWRWCFWINLPICGLAFLLTFLFLDIPHQRTPWKVGLKAIDWFGIAAFFGCTLMLLLGLNFGGTVFPWSSAKVIALLVTGGLLICVFIYGEARVAKYPLMPLGLFKNLSNIASLFVCIFQGFVFMGIEYYLPLYFQSVLSASALRSGVLILPFVISEALAGLVSGLIMHVSGCFRELIWVGTALMCLGTGLFMIWGVNPSIGKLVGVQILAGAGCGTLFSPPLIAIQSQVKPSDTSTATSTFGFSQKIAITLSVIIGGSVFANSMNAQASSLLQSGLPPSTVELLDGENAAANIMLASTISDPTQAYAIRKVFALSIHNLFVMYTVMAAGAIVAGLFVKKSHLAKEHIKHTTGLSPEVEPKR